MEGFGFFNFNKIILTIEEIILKKMYLNNNNKKKSINYIRLLIIL